MAVIEAMEEDEVMEVDYTPEYGDKSLLMNGIAKRLTTTTDIKLLLEKPNIYHLNVDDFLLKCSSSIFKENKCILDEQVQNLKDSIKKAQSTVLQTERLTEKVNNIVFDRKSIFKIPVNISQSLPYPKTYSRTGTYNNNLTRAILPKPPGTIVPKEQVVGDVLEILSTVNTAKGNLPPVGELVRRPIEVGSRVWAMKKDLLNVWVKGVIVSIKVGGTDKLYRVRLDNQKHMGNKNLPLKHLAYENNASVIIPVGTRIIARYTDSAGRSAHYAGIVAEPPKITNNKRYLIFFDDGCAQYVKHEDLYVVCAQSVDVADDVHDNISDFVRGYLLQYPERPMVKLQVDQYVKTEYNYEWSDAKVLEVDCSMVKMLFPTTERKEWIYRGSTRLKPLRNELANAEAHRLEGKNRRRHNIPRRPHQPYIEYTREDDVVVLSDSDDDKKNVLQDTRVKPRNTARKSLGTRPFTTTTNHVKHNAVFRVTDKKSHLGYKDTSRIKQFTRTPYQYHDCGPRCRETSNPATHRGKNPLLIPILLGWERQFRKFRMTGPGAKIVVVYRTPCGRHIRNAAELQKYLYQLKSLLTVDLFSFDCNLHTFRSFRPKEIFYKDDDITKGRENVPVSCVNSLADDPPPYVEYSAERFPGEGVFLNLDSNFLCGCDCTDNCQNPATCACQQHTNYAKYGKNVGDAGYKFRRLREPIVTGIYECNSRCKCNSQCGNRVVQNGLTVRLQMFKTQYKGWGIRCLDDIDAGQFICVYAGQLLTEQGADEDGKECGDEYLAELDHIEVVEKSKEGYESDVPDVPDMPMKFVTFPEKEEENASSDDQYAMSSDSDVVYDSDYEIGSNLRSTATTYATRSRRKTCKKGSYSSDSNAISEDSSSCAAEDKVMKELPDISTHLETCKINARSPSPESAEALEKIQLKRKPDISADETFQQNNPQSLKMETDEIDAKPKWALQKVAKKSVSMKSPLTSLQYDHKDSKFKSVRSYFGEDSLYIMDAKSKGNIGRYLNHSCEPNVFVQNVFVDTHDLRFPSVAFFASTSIDAGTELTWDYNYEVGSVSDKVMYCYCEASSCRGRLL